MGHSRLGLLPQSFAWEDVIAQVAGGANAAVVATATMNAAADGLQAAARDKGLRHVFLILTQVALAAQADGDFALALRDVGLTVPAQPSLFDLISGFTGAVDDHLLSTGGRTDFGEMAQMAAAESLAEVVGAGATSLYGTTPAEVRDAVAALASERGFGRLAHDFFARLTQRFLTYHLSRELSAHVGPGRRFADVDAHAEFVGRLRVTCEETAGIVKTFAGQWYGKTRHAGQFTPNQVRDFVHGAFKKIRAELDVRGGRHAPA